MTLELLNCAYSLLKNIVDVGNNDSLQRFVLQPLAHFHLYSEKKDTGWIINCFLSLMMSHFSSFFPILIGDSGQVLSFMLGYSHNLD